MLAACDDSKQFSWNSFFPLFSPKRNTFLLFCKLFKTHTLCLIPFLFVIISIFPSFSTSHRIALFPPLLVPSFEIVKEHSSHFFRNCIFFAPSLSPCIYAKESEMYSWLLLPAQRFWFRFLLSLPFVFLHSSRLFCMILNETKLCLISFLVIEHTFGIALHIFV